MNVKGAQVGAMVNRGELAAVKVGDCGLQRAHRQHLDASIERVCMEMRLWAQQQPLIA